MSSRPFTDFFVGDVITLGEAAWRVIDDTRHFCAGVGKPEEAELCLRRYDTGATVWLTPAELTTKLESVNPSRSVFVARRRAKGEKTCPKHPEDGPFLKRQCPTCQRENARAYRERMYAARAAMAAMEQEGKGN